MGEAQLARTFLESTRFSKYTKFITKWTELLVQNFGQFRYPHRLHNSNVSVTCRFRLLCPGGSEMGGAQLARTFLESTRFSKYTKFITKWTELLVQNFGQFRYPHRLRNCNVSVTCKYKYKIIRALRGFQCFLNVKTKKSTNFIETQLLTITQFSDQQIAKVLIKAGGGKTNSMHYMVHKSEWTSLQYNGQNEIT